MLLLGKVFNMDALGKLTIVFFVVFSLLSLFFYMLKRRANKAGESDATKLKNYQEALSSLSDIGGRITSGINAENKLKGQKDIKVSSEEFSLLNKKITEIGLALTALMALLVRLRAEAAPIIRRLEEIAEAARRAERERREREEEEEARRRRNSSSSSSSFGGGSSSSGSSFRGGGGRSSGGGASGGW